MLTQENFFFSLRYQDSRQSAVTIDLKTNQLVARCHSKRKKRNLFIFKTQKFFYTRKDILKNFRP